MNTGLASPRRGDDVLEDDMAGVRQSYGVPMNARAWNIGAWKC